MKKVLVIQGSPRRNGNTETACRYLQKGIQPAGDVRLVNLYQLKIRPCLGCRKCMRFGACVISGDDFAGLWERVRRADLEPVAVQAEDAERSEPASVQILAQPAAQVRVDAPPEFQRRALGPCTGCRVGHPNGCHPLIPPRRKTTAGPPRRAEAMFTESAECLDCVDRATNVRRDTL